MIKYSIIELIENTNLNQLTLVLRMMPAWLIKLQELEEQIVEKLNTSPEQLQAVKESLEKAIGNVSIPKTEGVEAAIATFAQNISSMPKIQYDAIGNALMEIAKQSKEIAASAKLLSDKLAEKASEKASESAEKSADSLLMSYQRGKNKYMNI